LKYEHHELLVRMRPERGADTRTGTGAARAAAFVVDPSTTCQPGGTSTTGRIVDGS
jgi:hypothetical protein